MIGKGKMKKLKNLSEKGKKVHVQKQSLLICLKICFWKNLIKKLF